MATEEYNQFPDKPAPYYSSDFSTALTTSPQQSLYGNLSPSISQGQYNNQYSEGPAHNYSISYLPETTESSGEHQYVNFPQSLPYQVNTHHDPARGNNTQGQWTNEGPPNQPITKADSEPFNGQGTEVATNHTGKSTHSEEFRTETHEISKKTDPDPEIENPKPANNKEGEGETARALQGQRPNIHTEILTLAEEPEEEITQHRSYHNEISGEEAKKRLRVFSDHHYLTRYSENWKFYVLSVYMSDEDLETEKFKHYKLKVSGEGIRILDHKLFESLEIMLKYYENNRLDPAFPRIGVCLTEEDYKIRVREIRDRQPNPDPAPHIEEPQAQQPNIKCTII